MKPMLKYSLNGSANIIIENKNTKHLKKNKTPGNLLFNFTVQTAMVRLLVRPIATSP